MKSDVIVLVVLIAAVAGTVALSLYATWRARGLVRILAALPVLTLLAVGLNIILGIARDPTAHNLWPLELLLSCLIGSVYSLAFLGIQKVVWRRKQRSDHLPPDTP